jgi:hypothetical protein
MSSCLWREQVNACTSDGLHHVSVRTAGLIDETVAESSDEETMDAAFEGRRMLRVTYEGPQRFETTADPEHSGAPVRSRVDQVLVSV